MSFEKTHAQWTEKSFPKLKVQDSNNLTFKTILYTWANTVRWITILQSQVRTPSAL